MAEITDRRQIYYIPDNYIEEGRILQGSVKVKNLIQGICIALPMGLLGWALGSSLKAKIVLTIVLAGPLLLIGVIGYNGDSLFTVFKSFNEWRKGKSMKLYNPKPTPFYVSPTETIFATEQTRDKIVGAYEERQKRRIEEHLNQNYVEGENFVFADDPTVQKYHDESQKPTENYVPEIQNISIGDSGDDLDELFDLGDGWGPRYFVSEPLDMGDDEF